MTDWLPARYFDWTPLSQTALFSAVMVFLSLLILLILKASPLASVALGVHVAMLLVFQYYKSSYSINIFSSAALLMCLYAVMQESWRMAYLDELTELPSRRALREKFQAISGTYTVAMLDVDHFKKFNDTHGHDVGDAVLRMIAAKMSKVTGSGSVYRYGGEEFAVVFTGKGCDAAEPHLEALRQTIANTPFVVNRQGQRSGEKKSRNRKVQTVQVTVSIGMADSRGQAGSPWGIMKQADKALYRAKKKGRNQLAG